VRPVPIPCPTVGTVLATAVAAWVTIMMRQNDSPAVTGTNAWVARFQATIASSLASSSGVMAVISAHTSVRSMPRSR
jgi:hypothetical protein